MTKPIRLGVICDLREEGWYSMDLIADMLMETLPAIASTEISATRLCPSMVPRWSRLPLVGGAERARFGDRLTGRLWDYPRWLAPRANDFDLFHIIDHSYAHLVRVLPAERTIVTCHDLDAVQATLLGNQKRLDPARLLATRILEGLGRAAHVACVSHATKDELIATGHVNPERVSVVYEGVHPSCSPFPDARWDEEVAKTLGPPRLELLHVGSTIPRKRLDIVLETLRSVRDLMGDVRLLRVGGRLTAWQRDLAARLGVLDAIVEFPFIERGYLAALYRRASVVVLPSDREGFGLPVIEAMACGTPVVACAIPALQEIGGNAAIYCPRNSVRRWVNAVSGVLRQLTQEPAAREARRHACIAHAARFNWKRYAAEMTKIYVKTHARGAVATARTHAS